MKRDLEVVVVGAGAFGGWTALELQRAGCRVTLIDAWGPGNARASSGGESRVIRCGYGSSSAFTASARRAWKRWIEEERRLGASLLEPTGVLWLLSDEDAFTAATQSELEGQGIPFEALSVDDVVERWPQISTEGIRSAFYEPEAGLLRAATACRYVAQAVQAEGGTYLAAEASPGRHTASALESLRLAGGDLLKADRYVFACGPWLRTLFPLLFDRRLFPTRQELFFFGTPPGDARWEAGTLPVWVDYGDIFWYGIPAYRGKGFKIGDDTRGPLFDPTAGDRTPSDEGAAAAAEFLARRFPALGGAPLLEGRVCQYSDTTDLTPFCERHPDWRNVWLIGGGSGHGFKHGPVMGERAAAAVLA